ncbi:MAG: hypothetical protein NZ553_19680 [Caldilinea sp.]|nr:hypothetical protein [Caldilinea sp.]MDW8442705.1 hypothetical protein [Caldilineaceae bacterium]
MSKDSEFPARFVVGIGRHVNVDHHFPQKPRPSLHYLLDRFIPGLHWPWMAIQRPHPTPVVDSAAAQLWCCAA